MLNINLKNLRKAKGLSQEELAIQLNVVRQTVSKWEQGLSVPDSDMLIHIAEVLDTNVNVLLGEEIVPSPEDEIKVLAAKLELLNSQFARRNNRRRQIWRTVFIVVGAVSLCICILSIAALLQMTVSIDDSLSIIGGADGPTEIIVTSAPLRLGTMSKFSVFISAVITAAAAIGIFVTGKK